MEPLAPAPPPRPRELSRFLEVRLALSPIEDNSRPRLPGVSTVHAHCALLTEKCLGWSGWIGASVK